MASHRDTIIIKLEGYVEEGFDKSYIDADLTVHIECSKCSVKFEEVAVGIYEPQHKINCVNRKERRI